MSSSTYKQFLTAPNSALLAPNATLHYVTTTTFFNGATEIIKHFSTIRNQLKKKKEDFLDVIQGPNALFAEIDTTLEFLTSGGAYVPELDDNFLSDRTVYLPITHVVSFDNDGRIAHIRQTWDQGALLKQLDIIGKTGRNWPIRDSREQLRMITSALKASGKLVTAPDTNEITIRLRGNSSNAMRDPHTSLDLFAPRSQQGDETPSRSIVSPYAGTRPHQRSFTEILGDEPVDEISSPTHGRERSQSPSKSIAPKFGSGKNYPPSRLFDTDESIAEQQATPEKVNSPEKFYRPHPNKYQHFDFADGSEPQDAPQAGHSPENAPKTKHDSNWSFADFVTPQKAKPSKSFKHNVRHWDTDHDNQETQETPIQRPQQQQGRRDAEAHFELRDDGLPQGEPRLQARPKGTAHNAGLRLYDNHVSSEDGSAPPAESGARALGNITNLKNRQQTFDPHFAMTDDSPSQADQAQPKVSEDRKKAVKMMDSNWDSYDESPAAKENKPANGSGQGPKEGGIRIAGDGMGGTKGTNRDWLYDTEQDIVSKAVPGKKPQGSQNRGQGSLWDF